MTTFDNLQCACGTLNDQEALLLMSICAIRLLNMFIVDIIQRSIYFSILVKLRDFILRMCTVMYKILYPAASNEDLFLFNS